MSLRYTPYMLPFVFSAAVLAAVLVMVWRNRSKPGARELAAAIVCMFIWAAGYALEIASSDVDSIIFWANVQFLGISAAAPFWLLMALRYSGSRPLPRWVVAALFVVPVITNVLAWTDSWHHLFRSQPQLDTSGPTLVLNPGYGTWVNFVLYPYIYVLFTASSLVMLGRLFTVSSPYRWQALLLAVAPLLPLLVGGLYVFDVSPIYHYNFTTATLPISSLIMALAIVRYRFLDIVPVARNELLESMEDGIVVLDVQCRVVDINPAAVRLAGSNGQALGQHIGKAFPALAALVEHCRNSCQSQLQTVVEADTGQMLEVAAAPLRNGAGDLAGYLVVVRDISERKRAESEREKLIAQLQQALAEVKTLSGLLPICASCKRVRNDQGYWQQIETYVSEHSQAQFSHGLCPECLARLYSEYCSDDDLPAGTATGDAGAK
ncbi:MAG: histidine kinase N-terminal 7TM domain-containing protein [Anaerolineae bacterium]